MTQVLDWTSRFNFGNPRSINQITGICIHVTVNSPGTPAENVANYQIRTQSGSYHELVDATGKVLIENTDDWLTWSAGPTSNLRHLHRSFVMRGTESAEEWKRYDAMLRTGAKRDAAWAKRYGIPIVKLSAADLRAGKRGFFGHLETAQAWGETDHVDPGPGFPWDYYLGLVREYANVTQKGNTDMALLPDERAALNDTKLYARDNNAQLTGSTIPGQYPGWPQLGGRTVVDAVAVIGAKLGIDGFHDPKERK